MSAERYCPEHPGNHADRCQPCKRATAPMPQNFWELVDAAKAQAAIQREYDREQGKAQL